MVELRITREVCKATHSAHYIFGYSEQIKGWRVAIGSTVHEPPSVVFNEEKSGATSVVPKQYSTDCNSHEESEEDVSTCVIMHMPFAHTQEEHEDENDVQDVSEGTDTEMEGAGFGETQAEQAAVQEQDVRRSSRVRNKEHPDASNLLDHSCMEGYACVVGVQNVPRSYTDIASFADMQERWYASVEREIAIIRDMGVVSESPKQMFVSVLQFTFQF
jgi:hypothetical protein